MADTEVSLLSTNSPATAAAMRALMKQYPPREAAPSTWLRVPFAGIALSRSTLVPSLDTIYGTIGYVTQPVTLTAPTVYVSVGQAGATCRVGIATFDAATRGTLPGALLVDFGTADCSASGTTPTFSNGAATVTLNPGTLYCVMFIAGGSATAPTMSFINHVALEPAFQYVSTGALQFPASHMRSSQSAQRTGGFATDPLPGATQSLTSSVPGQYNFVFFGN